MIWFPHAKINLGLAVIEKRLDGYHSIESVFHPIRLFDLLEIVPGKQDKLSLSGFPLDCSSENNLVWKALILMRRHFEFPPLEIHLHKLIPSGSGLGGGSSDAAHTLLGIKQLFNLDINNTSMNALASVLGSDCPFFLEPETQYAKERGEVLEPFSLNFRAQRLLLIVPDFSVSTESAYHKIEANRPQTSPKKALEMPIENWKRYLRNDFERIVFEEFPLLADLKERLYKNGANYASLSGSGSAMYALFSKKTKIELPNNYLQYWMEFPA